jgi:hypothetical protein
MTQNLLILSDQIRKTLGIPQVINIIDQLPKHQSKTWPARNFNLLEGITVHHFASEAPIVNQANYHINAHGWAGIAYAVIIRDGQILQTNYLDKRTTHASGGNDNTIGICIGGDLSKRSITDFERRALTGIVLGLKEMFPDLWVKGHNQISKTSCPCTDMNRIRADILATEEQIHYLNQPSAQIVKAFAITDRIKSLCDRINDPKYGGECKRKVMLFATIESLETPEGVKKRVVEDLYTKAINGGKEAVRKLGLYYDFAEENRLL